MKEILLIICGHGALAKALLDHEAKISTSGANVHMYAFDDISVSGMIPPYPENTFPIAIHAAKSGSQLPQLIAFCEQRGIPLIQAATGMKLPPELKIPVIDAPNMAIEIIALLKSLPSLIDGITKGKGVVVKNIWLVESHQASKGNSVPGTARKIGAMVGLPDDKIISVRDPNIQLLIGVPMANLDRHAYHTLEIEYANGTRIRLQTIIHNLDTYASGGVFLAQRITELNLLPGLHPMTELL